MEDFGEHDDFPPVSHADPDGLLAVGGGLTPRRVLAAYQRGIFPWPLDAGGVKILTWFSPDPRAIIELDGIHVARRLARRLRGECFHLTCDHCFGAVIAGCAAPRSGDGDTWITPEMNEVYCRLHALGHAHSIEVWRADELVGGLYGIRVGGFFAGESMFHRVRDASKVALVALVAHLRARGFRLFDIQQATRHAFSMGAIEIPRPSFLARLAEAAALPVTFGSALDLSLLPDVLRRS